MHEIAPISRQIWDMKYRFKTAEDQSGDTTIDDSWRRVAKSAASVEKEPELWSDRFHDAFQDFAFLPAGRIVAGAGTGRSVTLFNCFVMGAVPDDMGGIFAHLREAALTLQQGGGIGYDFSTLRPKGAPVLGVGADASGPLSFMDVWDAMCRTIMSAGSRRGAMMATLRCDHPDIEAFIEAKRDSVRLRMFNLSVLVTDAFMQAVEDGTPWPLSFNGKVYRVVEARALWDSIMRATYDAAEPGVIFIDRINDRNNLWYCENISATNPCITSDSWVQTSDGPRQVADLISRPFKAVVDGEIYESGAEGFFSTGRKPVLRLTTVEGHSLRLTANHPLKRVTLHTRFGLESDWTVAGDLHAGDQILLNDHRNAPAWSGRYTEEEGYLIGLLIGDGTLKSDKAVLSAWPGYLVANGGRERLGVAGVMEHAERAARTLKHRSDFSGWIEIPGRGEFRLAIGALKSLAAELGMTPGNKRLTPAIESASKAFYAGFLRGFFDADGSVQGTQLKGVSIRLAQSDLPRLQAVQRMLLRLGIVAQIYPNRHQAGSTSLPAGRGGQRDYATLANHELVITNDSVQIFAESVGFSDREKSARLAALIASYKRRPNRSNYLGTVASVETDGEEEVFDVQIPGINAFDANGFLAHNCGEQPLPPYGACLLGSINLARLIDQPFAADAALNQDRLSALVATAIRLLDNVIDLSRFPLEAQRDEAKAKRRIGLGVTGLADALIMVGLRYGSPESIAAVEAWMKGLQRAAYLASTGLAAEKGAFPLFDRDKFLAGKTVAALDPDIRAAIARYGIRNSLLTSIAPTGTISLLADNVSSGIEPVFSFTYNRAVLMPDGTRQIEEVSDYAYRLFRQLHGATAPLPPAFVDAHDLTPRDHLSMQAAVQKYIDSSISKTINLPAEIPFEAFKTIYAEAYATGCKGCTTYRPNDITGSVLSRSGETAPAPEVNQPPAPETAPRTRTPEPFPAAASTSEGVYYMTQPLSRPEALPGQTYKLRWPESDHAIYITVNDIVQDGRRRPFEVFINSKNMDHYAWTVGLTRMISAVFRRGGDVAFVVEELQAVFDPRGGAWIDGRYVPSLLAAIGDVIKRHMIEIGFIANPAGAGEASPLQIAAVMGESGRQASCPRCGNASLIRQEGCAQCTTCGYSKCG